MPKASDDPFGPPIAFRPAFVKIAGSANAALFLSQCFYWSSKHETREGWFYKTAVQWTEETGLTRREQERVRDVLLSKGLIQEMRTGAKGIMHFRAMPDAISNALRECTKTPNRTVSENGGKRQTESVENGGNVQTQCTKTPNRNGGKRTSLYINTKTSTETSTERECAREACIQTDELTPEDMGARKEVVEPVEFQRLVAAYPIVCQNRLGALRKFKQLKPDAQMIAAMAKGLKAWRSAGVEVAKWPDLMWWIADQRWNDPPPSLRHVAEEPRKVAPTFAPEEYRRTYQG